MKRIWMGLLLATWLSAAFATEQEVRAATQRWAEAFNSHDIDKVLALYEEDAVLWGTISPTIRYDRAAFRDYFKTLPSRPNAKVAIGEQRTRVYGDFAVNTGYYTFTDVRDGQPVTTPARFSFTYRKRFSGWMIVDHHSSRVPPPPQ